MKRPHITPGPWNFTKGVTPCINASIDRHQITVAKTIYGSHDEALANAGAIAALPALLAALESALDLIAELNEGGAENPEESEIRDALTLAGYEF